MRVSKRKWEALEKRVADLEIQVQNQPKISSAITDEISLKIAEKLEKHFNAVVR